MPSVLVVECLPINSISFWFRLISTSSVLVSKKISLGSSSSSVLTLFLRFALFSTMAARGLPRRCWLIWLRRMSVFWYSCRPDTSTLTTCGGTTRNLGSSSLRSALCRTTVRIFPVSALDTYRNHVQVPVVNEETAANILV